MAESMQGTNAGGFFVGGLRHYLLALQFFTRVPMPARLAAWVGFSSAMMRAANGHFPGVGWLVGGCAALALWVAHACLGAGVPMQFAAVVLSVMATVWLTGAFHEDGLADVGDALGGHADREQALRIMKDSRLGSYGTLTILLVLLLKIGLLTALLQQGLAQAVVALLSVHVLSRWAPLWLIRWLPYVGGAKVPTQSGAEVAADDAEVRSDDLQTSSCDSQVSLGDSRASPDGSQTSPGDLQARSDDPQASVDGSQALPDDSQTSPGDSQARSDDPQTRHATSKSRDLAENVSGRALLVGTLWALPAMGSMAVCFGGFSLGWVLLMGVIVTVLLGRFFRRRIGGITGDCLGATQQLVEVSAYLVLAAGVAGAS